MHHHFSLHIALYSHHRSQANILPAIFECARPDTCPVELNIEAAQLLLVLSEDSAAFAAQVKGNAMCVQVCSSSKQPHAAHTPQP